MARIHDSSSQPLLIVWISTIWKDVIVATTYNFIKSCAFDYYDTIFQQNSYQLIDFVNCL